MKELPEQFFDYYYTFYESNSGYEFQDLIDVFNFVYDKINEGFLFHVVKGDNSCGIYEQFSPPDSKNWHGETTDYQLILDIVHFLSKNGKVSKNEFTNVFKKLITEEDQYPNEFRLSSVLTHYLGIYFVDYVNTDKDIFLDWRELIDLINNHYMTESFIKKNKKFMHACNEILNTKFILEIND